MKCYFCQSKVTEDDFCHGCQESVCSACDETMAMGVHVVEEHQKRPEEEGDEEEGDD